MPVIIDGYNVIYAIDAVRPHGSPKSSAAEREKFLLLLGHYAAISRQDLTVVFDGGPGRHPPKSPPRLQLVFSGHRSADSRIKEMVEKSSYAREIAVVSSDREIRTFVKRYGAKSVSAKAFASELKKTLREKSQMESKAEPRDRMVGPGESDRDFWLDYFGMDADEVKRQNGKLRDLW